jgi:hypothetical protein
MGAQSGASFNMKFLSGGTLALTSSAGMTISTTGTTSDISVTSGKDLSITAGAVNVVASSGLSVTGGLTVRNVGLNIVTGGLTITAGGLNIAAGGMTLTTGGMTISNSGLFVSGGLTVVGGNIHYANSVMASDRRLKTNVVPLQNSLYKVSKIRGVYFNWAEDSKTGKKLDDKRRHLGVIAQEVRDIIPEAVSGIEDDQFYGVAYTELIPLLLDAVRELDEKVQSQASQAPHATSLGDTKVLMQSIQSILRRVEALEKSQLSRESILKRMDTMEKELNLLKKLAKV